MPLELHFLFQEGRFWSHSQVGVIFVIPVPPVLCSFINSIFRLRGSLHCAKVTPSTYMYISLACVFPFSGSLEAASAAHLMSMYLQFPSPLPPPNTAFPLPTPCCPKIPDFLTPSKPSIVVSSRIWIKYPQLWVVEGMPDQGTCSRWWC
jgi:hypothetical protein